MDKKTLKDFVREQTQQVKDDFDFFNPEADEAMFHKEVNHFIPGVQVFNHFDVKEALLRTHTSKLRDVLKTIAREPLWKPFAQIQTDTIQKLDELEKQFPNFSEVITLCKTNITLSSLENPGIIQLPPMLLSGPPGMGKTLFMQSLASVLGTGFYSLDMSTLSTGFMISGSTSAWSDSKPGFISESLRKSVCANPVIMLDEVDKVSGSSQFDPLGPFYSLLEEHTAKRFVDEFLEIPMDASAVIWVATANYPERIPAPIRSRMRVIEISPPNKAQAAAIAQSVYQGLLMNNSWGRHFAPKLSEHVVRKLVSLPPRQMRHRLKEAMGQAVHRSGGRLRPIVMMPRDIAEVDIERRTKRGIGFLANI